MVQENVQNKASQTGLHTHEDQQWKARGQENHKPCHQIQD